ncbi:DoxX family protein [Ramlibacter sp. WS9]|uniref:DoxX family protein n=1 Tax=Ramlibacter sp. WS9 TaxID=1882741 RepID=UPI001144900C|nr:DoxX family protein [Ramlibacter sp. WS9]ROZ75089.1 DoxX family protein [Ramlibacter sp. WS9]
MNATPAPASLHAELSLAARILILVIFAVSGIRKIVEFPVFVAFIASKGLPFPEACAILAAVLEIGGTVLLVVGWKTRQTALVLTVYTLFLAFVFHNFWNLQTGNMTPVQASNQMNHFLKNISIAGGLLLLAALGPGAWSVDMRSKKTAGPKLSPLKT